MIWMVIFMVMVVLSFGRFVSLRVIGAAPPAGPFARPALSRSLTLSVAISGGDLERRRVDFSFLWDTLPGRGAVRPRGLRPSQPVCRSTGRSLPGLFSVGRERRRGDRGPSCAPSTHTCRNR